MTESTFLKELISIRQENQNGVVILSLFVDERFKFQPHVCDGCHVVLMMSINLSDIAILNFHGADYCCIIGRISKIEAMNLMLNIDLTRKSRTL